ncbi:MAG: alcohol dehydrogenase catalytic domain-containing protein [Sphingobium sp.]
MRAAVFRGLGQKLEICDLPDPRPGTDELLISIGRCGICGSDLHMTEDQTFGLSPGSILGHEFAGEVVETGPGVVGFSIGDRVTVPPMQGCGHCAYCLADEPGHCPQMVLLGGGYGELSCIQARQAVRLPAGVSLANGALVEPLAVALHGIRKSSIRPGDKVVVLGAGPIGLATAFWARRMGAARVVVTDLGSWQEQRALAMGATHFVSGDADHVALADALLGSKADIVFECVGAPGLIAQAIQHLRPKGEILVQGLCTRPDNFIPFHAIMKECRIQFSNFFHLAEFQAALDMFDSGAAEPGLMITDTIKLDQLPGTFEALRQRTHQCKVQIAH